MNTNSKEEKKIMEILSGLDDCLVALGDSPEEQLKKIKINAFLRVFKENLKNNRQAVVWHIHYHYNEYKNLKKQVEKFF